MSERIPLILGPGLMTDTRMWEHQLENLSDIADMKLVDTTKYSSLVDMAKRMLDEEPPTFARQSGKLVGAWLQAIERTLRQDYLEPAGIAERGAGVTYPVVLLASRGDYTNFVQAGGRRLNFSG